MAASVFDCLDHSCAALGALLADQDYFSVSAEHIQMRRV